MTPSLLTDPALHLIHDVLPDDGSEPDAHCEHDPFTPAYPALQATHAVRFSLGDDPLSHTEHTPWRPAYFARQATHPVLAMLDVVPSWQRKQAVEFILLYVPASQGTH